ncbi:hypothetical protein T458_24490 [Brevibacillus panacihumi W25]|uniref:Thymidylate synthase/dCMP hydroxymethylase domain-containing protein n=1 Tax=Brevibacillus panacihumi W25 TaxID=1408254 RepID=V6M1F8_9BACL|nr:thymidylate synthase [Brevibacillus panacihumi]EST52177.1 hypothetical protein T458_24490 [Brevibacillus panacihumi W25]
MMNYYRFRTPGEMFHGMLRKVVQEGRETKFNKVLNARQIDFVFCEIDKPLLKCEFQSLSCMLFDIVETIFVLSGRTDSYVLKQYKGAMEFFDQNGHFPEAVGPRLYSIYGDQIAKCLAVLSEDHESRQAIICLMNPKQKHMPCSTYIQFLIREGKLDMYLNYRATHMLDFTNSDTHTYSTLLELMAGWLKVEVGRMYYSSTCLHVTEPFIKANELINRGPIINYNVSSGQNIKVECDYSSYREKFSFTLDVLTKWHQNGISDNVENYFSSINHYELPYFLKYWLKVLLLGVLYGENRNEELIREKLSLLEQSDLRISFEYFISNPAHKSLEVV